MPKLIDADNLAETYRDTAKRFNYEPWTLDEILDFINDAPAVDAVEVVRCKDCEHYQCCGNNAYGLCFDPKRKDGGTNEVREDDFCSYGERR